MAEEEMPKTTAELVKEGRDNSRAYARASDLRLPFGALNDITNELIRINQRWRMADEAERGPTET